MSNNYYKKSKEKLSKKGSWKVPKYFSRKENKKRQYAREWYRELSEEEKEKKHQYDPEDINNLLEHEYRKCFSVMQ